MKLKTLCKGLAFEDKHSIKDIDIHGISSDSRYTQVGDLFIAKRGSKEEGVDYMEDASSQGAVAFITSLHNPFIKAPQFVCKDPQQVEAFLLHRFYQECTKKMYLVGVTGTNGKTTTTHLIHHIFSSYSMAGLMSTLGVYYGDLFYPTTLTTNSIAFNMKTLYAMHHHGASDCAIEVSSHGLAQKRVEGFHFDQAIFLNLSQDHLDYHGTMDEYFSSKAELFSCLKGSSDPCIIANRDDPYFKKIQSPYPILSFGKSDQADLCLRDVQHESEKVKLHLSYRGEDFMIESGLWQPYNFYNIMAATASALHKKISLSLIQDAIATFELPPGRMQKVKSASNVYVDYAHTPEALEQALASLKGYKKGKLTVVFGCGGERDRKKRSMMAQVAERFADVTIVTSDNPRSEDPHEIINEVIKGFSKKGSFIVQPDRRQAIEQALKRSSSEDTLLIAGKGHEKVQIEGRKSLAFDDVAVVEKWVDSNS